MTTDDRHAAGGFLIQVESESPGGRLEASGAGIIKGSQEHLDAAADLARRAAATMSDVFRTAGPDAGSVEFALTFEGSAGLPVLAKGKIGATLTVRLEWNSEVRGPRE